MFCKEEVKYIQETCLLQIFSISRECFHLGIGAAVLDEQSATDAGEQYDIFSNIHQSLRQERKELQETRHNEIDLKSSASRSSQKE